MKIDILTVAMKIYPLITFEMLKTNAPSQFHFYEKTSDIRNYALL